MRHVDEMKIAAYTATCYHCGNRTPHAQVYEHTAQLLYEEVGDQRYYELFRFFVLTCGTCDGLSLFGGFQLEAGDNNEQPLSYSRLYPRGPGILPPVHTVNEHEPLPSRVLRTYTEAWPLRHLNPSAFANQIRRALEYVCEDQGAKGKSLADKLRDLATRNIFPPELADVANLVREVGNIGSHSSSREIDVWDAELIDELFCLILRYVYLGPSHLRRLRQRLADTL